MEYKKKLNGGKSDGKKPTDYNPIDIKIGKKVEKEHSKDNNIKTCISMDHLEDSETYYDELIMSGIADEKDAIEEYDKLKSNKDKLKTINKLQKKLDKQKQKLSENTLLKYKEFINENLNSKFHIALKYIRDKYSKKENKTLQQLNSGDCEDIAYDVIETFGGETSNTFIIDDGWFWNIDIKSKYKTKSNEYWNIKNLEKYGEPPFGYENLNKLDLIGHVWIFSNGKHYDVETIHGVNNFWYLPIYQRQLANLNLI
jgi:hypothetical protein